MFSSNAIKLDPRQLFNFMITKDEVNQLLTEGLDVNLRIDGMTPLHAAAMGWKDNPKVVRALIEAGVEVEALDNQGKTAFFYAAEAGKVKTIDVFNKYLFSGQSAQTPKIPQLQWLDPSLLPEKVHCGFASFYEDKGYLKFSYGLDYFAKNMLEFSKNNPLLKLNLTEPLNGTTAISIKVTVEKILKDPEAYLKFKTAMLSIHRDLSGNFEEFERINPMVADLFAQKSEEDTTKASDLHTYLNANRAKNNHVFFHPAPNTQKSVESTVKEPHRSWLNCCSFSNS